MRARRLTTGRHLGTTLIVVSALSTIIFIVSPRLALGWATALITLATVAHLALVFSRARVPLTVVVVAGVGLLTTAATGPSTARR